MQEESLQRREQNASSSCDKTELAPSSIPIRPDLAGAWERPTEERWSWATPQGVHDLVSDTGGDEKKEDDDHKTFERRLRTPPRRIGSGIAKSPWLSRLDINPILKVEQQDPSILRTGGGLKDETESNNCTASPPKGPQHALLNEQCHETSLEARPIGSPTLYYYRIIYRGVVALVREPTLQAPRSGYYLSYGDVIASPTPPSPSDALAILVEHVLTGGYAIDAPRRTVCSREREFVVTTGEDEVNENRSIATGDIHAETPRRSNMSFGFGDEHASVISHALTAISILTPSEFMNDGFVIPWGYLWSKNAESTCVVVNLNQAPRAESGHFRYKVVSTTPLPILTGPCHDAPKTKAVILPGTIQEISLRISFSAADLHDSSDADGHNEDICFLRLAHRRGWIADRKLIPSTRTQADQQDRCSVFQSVPVVKETTDLTHHAGHIQEEMDDDSSCTSVALSSIALSSASTIRRRHRLPRRKMIPEFHGDKPPRRNILGSDIHNKEALPHVLAASPSKYQEANSSSDLRTMTPSSNVSILSDDSSIDRQYHDTPKHSSSPKGHNLSRIATLSPDVSYGTNASTTSSSVASSSTPQNTFYLMRVTAPNGLRILDAPQFQVNNLIHGKSPHQQVGAKTESSSQQISSKQQGSIFQTMSGRLASSQLHANNSTNPAVFDASSKARVLPRGILFEASRRMEQTKAYSQGAGLIKLSDNSGWAIVPRREELDRQYRSYHGGLASVKEGEASRGAFEEVGNAVAHSQATHQGEPVTIWLRVQARGGLAVMCPPPIAPLLGHQAHWNGISEGDTSPTSSRGSSVVSGSLHGSSCGPINSHDSDVASSVGSSFLDAMFRTPKKKKDDASQRSRTPVKVQLAHTTDTNKSLLHPVNVPCGMCVEVECWEEILHDGTAREYARLIGGQGWLPMSVLGKPAAVPVHRPETRLGSFWFRVQSRRGVKVRVGPSQQAPSIKSEEGAHFRFECGEFLRACEIMTIFAESCDDQQQQQPVECYAKLYRNRHVRLYSGDEPFRSVTSLTTPSEWVLVYSSVENELLLDECGSEPRIERHKQGWRYNVVPESGVPIRKGPSFAAEKTGGQLLGGESVMVNERVTAAGEKLTWLRLKNDGGWVPDHVEETGEQLMIAHALRHRTTAGSVARSARDLAAYNTIIARLFDNDIPQHVHGNQRPPRDLRGS